MSITTTEAPEATAPRRDTLRIVTTWAVLVASLLVSVNLLFVDYIAVRAYGALHQVAQQWAPAPAALPAPEAAPAAPAPASAPTAQQPDPGTVTAFGETHTYANGVQMTISTPQRHTPGRYATHVPEAHTVAFDVTVANGTAQPLDLGMSRTSVQAGGQESTKVYDGATGSPPATKVLPGKSVTWTVVYGVASLDDITVQASPGSEYADQIWTSSAYRP